MERKWQLEKFTELRFEYYSAGRTLWFSDNMETGAILLGYAVELSLKQVLVASGNDGNKRLMEKHTIAALYKHANETALHDAVPASQDLLHFVSDRLHHRYPRQVAEAAASAQERGHAICLALDVIFAYDDLVIGLDEWLRVNYPEEKISLGLLAAHFIKRVTGRAVFHCNSAALSRSASYVSLLEAEYANSEAEMKEQGRTPETIAYNLENQRGRIHSWSLAPNGLWVFKNLMTPFGASFVETPSELLAKNFVYPGRYVKANGS